MFWALRADTFPTVVTRKSRWWAVVIGLSAVALGCDTNDPTARINGCLFPAVERIRADSESTSRVECDFQDQVLFAGFPGRAIAVEELTKAGLSDDTARSLAEEPRRADQWCLIQEHLPSATPPTDGKVLRVRLSCVDSTVVIPRVFVSRGRGVLVTLIRAADNRAQVDSVLGRP